METVTIKNTGATVVHLHTDGKNVPVLPGEQVTVPGVNVVVESKAPGSVLIVPRQGESEPV